MTTNEIESASERGYRMLLQGTDENDTETRIVDAVANLAILAQETLGESVADLIVKGLAHYAATYIEPMEPDEAEAWLHDELHPFTGERQFAEYVAEKAIILAGHEYKVAPPEWGI